MIEFDAVVIGAGPAGATAALNLAPFHRVLLVDRHAQPTERIGESLAAAAGRLLRDMGLLAEFKAAAHLPCPFRRSRWGSDIARDEDALRDLDGPGWLIRRAEFEAHLRAVAVRRGTMLMAPARPIEISHKDGSWQLALSQPKGSLVTLHARLLIDAGGRASSLLRSAGARRRADDRLICGWVIVENTDRTDFIYTEAEPDGWWYTAPLPDRRRVVAFHTDSDLPAAAAVRSSSALWKRARAVPGLRDILQAPDLEAGGPLGVCAAHTSVIQPFVGFDWLAVGDAAMSFDPLSSQGLFNALYTGLAGAEAADACLSGDGGAVARYAEGLGRIYEAYRRHFSMFYATERRWADRLFWRRRQAACAPVSVIIGKEMTPSARM